MIGVLAELGRSLIVERTRAGVKAAQKRGVNFGRKRGRIGDNHLPEPIDEIISSEEDAADTAKQLREELEKPSPDVFAAKNLFRHLGKSLGVATKWVGHKLDAMAEEAAKSFGKFLGETLGKWAPIAVGVASVAPHIQGALTDVWEKMGHWLHLATAMF